MPRIFISYRRADSNSITGRIHDSLEAAFGGDNIFKDVDDIPLGSDFREILDHQISLNEVLLVIIGKQWLSVTDAEGLRRLDNSSDFVSIEIESALKRDDMLIIPVLVNSANMPTESDLPPSLKSLAFLNAATVRDDPDYHRDMERLIHWLRSYGDSLANVELILANIDIRQTWTEIVEQLEQARKAAGAAKTLQAKVNDAHQSWEQIKGTMVSELLDEIAFHLTEGRLEQAKQVYRQIKSQEQLSAKIRNELPSVEHRIRELEIKQRAAKEPVSDRSVPANRKLKSTSQQSPQVAEKPVASIYGRKEVTQSNNGLYLGGIVMGILLLAAVLGGYLIISQLTNGTDTLAQNGVASNAEWESQYPDGFIQEFDGLEMVLVPAGCFMMGSESGDNDEKPVHEQCFEEPFWIDLTEVTQADFEHLGGQKENNNSFDGANRPVERITWFEARDFCQLRGMRLPTEREWEYAARGPDNLVYPWGNEWNENNAVWSGNSGGETVEVGSISNGTSWVGALDMSGNVWEWTSSLFEDYPYEDDHEDSNDTNNSRALRSGSWYDSGAELLRAANRYGDSPDNWINYLGFRCARSSN